MAPRNRGPINANELITKLQQDPAYQERRRRRDWELQQKEQEYARAEKPLVEELRAAGADVTSAWDLVNSKVPYSDKLLPILAEHLQRPYPAAVRDGIARALAVPGARFAWNVLISLYREERENRVKQGLAVAIPNIADQALIPQVINLVRNPQNGESRVLLLFALKRWYRDPRAFAALEEFASEPFLKKQAQIVLRQLAARKRR
jgi:hypothetical protein